MAAIEKQGFTKTREKMDVTFNGWDGKSYNGESQRLTVWVHPRHPGKKFVNKRKGGFERYDGSHYSIDAFFEITNNMIVEKATGIEHPEVDYFCSEEIKR